MPTPPEARKVIVGVDTHKHVHVAVAIDSWGIRLRDHAFVADSGGESIIGDSHCGPGSVRASSDSCNNACAGKARSRGTRCRDVIFETLFETLWVSNPIRPRSGDAADVRYLKNGAANAIRTLRAAAADAAPTDRVIGLSPLQIQRRFTAAAPRRRHRGARDGAQWPGRARVRTDGARRVHHGSHAGRELENRPHGRALLGRRDRRTRGRQKVFVAVVY